MTGYFLDEVRQPQIAPDDAAHLGLLVVDFPRRIDHGEIVARGEQFVLFEDSPLENPEALIRIRAPSHVHAGLVVFQLRPPVENPAKRHFERRAEKERHIRLHREAVQALHPVAVHAAHHVAGECRENVAIREDDVTRLEERKNLALVAIRKISRVNQRESRRGQRAARFSLARGRLDEAR